jgi:hypothetical protein
MLYALNMSQFLTVVFGWKIAASTGTVIFKIMLNVIENLVVKDTRFYGTDGCYELPVVPNLVSSPFFIKLYF